MGAMKSAQDVGNTLLNAAHVDLPLGGLSRDTRAQSNSEYEQALGNSIPALSGRVFGSVALTANPLTRAGEALSAMRGIGPAMNALRSAGWFGKTGANILAGAGAGAGSAAITSGGYNVPVIDQIESGALIGGVLGPVAPYIQKAGAAAANFGGKIAGKFSNPLTETADISQLGLGPLRPEVASSVQTEAAQQIAKTGQLDAAALSRKANMEQQGLKTTNAMVSRDPLEWTNEKEMAKTEQGKTLMQTYQQNNEVLKNNLKKFAGDNQADEYSAGESLINAAKAKWDEGQGTISVLYNQIRDVKGAQFASKLDELKKTMGEVSDYAEADPIVASLNRRMDRIGAGVKDVFGQVKGININQAEELRKFIGNLNGSSPTTRMVKAQLITSLDNDVISGAGEDAFQGARQAARERFSEFSSKILKDIVDERATPDTLMQRYVFGKSGTADDLGNLRQSLNSGSALQTQRGGQAWSDLRSNVAETILKKATNGNPEEGMLSYPKLRQALDQIGPQKLRIIFGDDGARNYDNILKALHDSAFSPGLAPVNNSNTTSAAIRALQAGDHLPVIGKLIGFGAKKMEEAAQREAVNNALMGSSVAGVKPPVEPQPNNPLLGRVLTQGALEAARQ